jgi:hypothetical protein
MTHFGIMMDEEYNLTHKRKRMTIWSGPFASVLEGEGLSLPKGDGYMITTYHGEKVRVECPVERTDANYEEQDKAINDALNKHYGTYVEPAKPVLPGPVEVAKEFVRNYKPYVPNGKPVLFRR